ncbi:hypothetical protein BC936DRAFT_145275 [Jimgerdemannia flammicorona]|uniref:Uncharacterized protein n=1 Tax=Jimgerdemannia flammicorona TaxID=994334 RepID=A0A433DAJ5_9FUNG|nr:hypothetical protein BC936DRAFT_145275 [Jimgerdemannia flammicorona]
MCYTLQFTYKAHDIPDKVWGGMLVYPPNQLDALVEASEELMQKGHSKSACLLAIARGPDGNCAEPHCEIANCSHHHARPFTNTHLPTIFQPVIIIVPFYQGPESEAQAVFSGFLSLPYVVSTVQMRPYSDMNGLSNDAAPFGGRKMFTDANIHHMRPATFREAFNSFVQFTGPATEGSVPGTSKSSIFVLAVPTAAIEARPKDSTAFAFRDPLIDVTIMSTWEDPKNDPKDDAKVSEWARSLQKFFLKDGNPNRMCMHFFIFFVGEGREEVLYPNMISRHMTLTQHRLSSQITITPMAQKTASKRLAQTMNACASSRRSTTLTTSSGPCEPIYGPAGWGGARL